MTDPLPALVDRCRALAPRGPRALVAVVGPPASGKSTIARQLADALGEDAAAVPMDGFHLDDRILEARGLRERKGSPPSFDAAGFVHAMARLASEPEVILPVFDRSREISIAGALAIGPDCRIAVVEGNYLCLDADPWHDLMALWDLSIFLDTPEPVLRARLTERWQRHGKADAETWIERNDMPNARLVKSRVLPVDITLRDDGPKA